MKNYSMRLLLAVLLTLPSLLTSCSDDKEEEVAPSKAELLVSHDWQGDKVLMMGIDVSSSGLVPGEVPDIKELNLTFNEDNTYIATTPLLTFEGDWAFNEDETKIDFDFLGLGEVDVEKLTEDNLNLSTSVTKGQLSMLAQLLQIDLGPIENLPDGTKIPVEIRFIKP